MTRESHNFDTNSPETNERRRNESNGCTGNPSRHSGPFFTNCDFCGQGFRSDTRSGTRQDCGGDHDDHRGDMRFTAEEWEERFPAEEN